MTLRIGWFSSSSDPPIIEAMQRVISARAAGVLDVEIGYLVAGSAAGGLAAVARSAHIPVVAIDPGSFRERAPSGWRLSYERAVIAAVEEWPVDLTLFFGYAWIAGPDLLPRLRAVNIHPAPPNGPVGRQAEVTQALADQGAVEAGLTAHVVTADLDRGPVLTFATWSLPDRKGTWPRRALTRADIDQAVASHVAEFCVETLTALARADLTTWPPPPTCWPIDLGPALAAGRAGSPRT